MTRAMKAKNPKVRNEGVTVSSPTPVIKDAKEAITTSTTSSITPGPNIRLTTLVLMTPSSSSMGAIVVSATVARAVETRRESRGG